MMTSLSKTEQMDDSNLTPVPKETKLVPMHVMKFRVKRRVERIMPDGTAVLITETLEFQYVPNLLLQKAVVDFFRSETVRMSLFFLTATALILVGGSRL